MTGASRPLPDSDARRMAAERTDLHILLSAGAGSGKTAALVDRYMAILDRESDVDVPNIAAITFTKRAAQEMRHRLREKFRERFDEARAAGDSRGMRKWRERLQQLETAPISTIHALCNGILAQFPLAAGLDPNFSVMSDLDVAVAMPRAVRESLLRGLEDGRESAARVVVFYEGLEQAADALSSIVRSRERYRRWLDGEIDAQRLLRQWEEAEREWVRQTCSELVQSPEWQELYQRLRMLASCAPEGKDALKDKLINLLQVLNENLSEGHVPQSGSELSELRQRVEQAAKSYGRAGSAKTWGSEEVIKEARGVIKAILEFVRSLTKVVKEAELDPSGQAAELAAAMWQEAKLANEKWREYKDLSRSLDYNDLQERALQLLRTNEAARRRVQARFRHILVDEFQDTNEIQRDIIWTIAGIDEDSGGAARVFIVGDAKQSIFRFRDADVSVFNRTRRDFGQRRDCLSLSLSVSFRPNRAMMEFFNELFVQPSMLGGEARADYEAPYDPLAALRDDVPIRPPVMGLLVASDESIAFRRRIEEARVIARLVRRLIEMAPPVYDHDQRRLRPLRPGDIAILLRAMSDVRAYEDQLTRAGLRFYSVSGRGFLDRPEVYDLINALEAAANPADDIAVVGVLRSPMFALSDNTLLWLAACPGSWLERLNAAAERDARQQEPFGRIAAEEYQRVVQAAELLGRWRAKADRLPVAALLEEIIDSTGYSGAMAAQVDGLQAVANINKLLDLARYFDASRSGGVEQFVATIRELSKQEAAAAQAPIEEAEGESIRISTVHSAKGLQWPVVIVADLYRQTGRGSTGPHMVMHPRWGIVPPEPSKYPPDKYRLIGHIAKKTESDEAAAEEARLLYVAMTRASDLLVLCSSVGSKATDEGGRMAKIGEGGWLGRLREACGLPEELPVPDETAPIPEARIGVWYVMPTARAELPEIEIAAVGESRERAAVSVTASGEPAAGDADDADSEERSDGLTEGSDDVFGPQIALARVEIDPSSRRRFAVTEIADYLSCPRFYWLRHVEGLPDIMPEIPEMERGLTPLERGTLVHRLLQMVGKGGARELDQLVGEVEVIPGGGALRVLAPEDAEDIREMVEWFLGTELYQNDVAAAELLRTEAWLSISVGEGIVVEGKVDAIAEGPGGATLIDYKTSTGHRWMDDEAGPDLDEFQIALYAWGLERLGRQPQKCVIAYLGTRELKFVDLPGAAEQAAEKARLAIARIRAGQFPAARDAEKCRICRLRWACEGRGDSG